MNAVVAFLHHLAAFTLVASLAVEFVLIRDELTPRNARRLQLADLVFGISAGAILVLGALRVAYFEKGAAYYLHSAPFIAKITLFALVGLLSVYPTKQFLRWGRAQKQGALPVVAAAVTQRIRTVIHLELALVALLILCAALMAKGIGQFA
jgi:putative membrane protein